MHEEVDIYLYSSITGRVNLSGGRGAVSVTLIAKSAYLSNILRYQSCKKLGLRYTTVGFLRWQSAEKGARTTQLAAVQHHYKIFI